MKIPSAYTFGIVYSDKKNHNNSPKTSLCCCKSAALLTAALLSLASYAKADVENSTISDKNLTYENSSQKVKSNIEKISKLIKSKPQQISLYQVRAEEKLKIQDIYGAIEDIGIARVLYAKTKQDLEKKFAATADDNIKDEIESYENIIKKCNDRIRVIKKIQKTGFDFTKERDYKIDEVHQGLMRNCYFIATLARLPWLIKQANCLKWNKDGSAEVSLYPMKLDKYNNSLLGTSERKTYHISNEELNSLLFKLKNSDGKDFPITLDSSQDMTLKALEIGYIKNLNYDFKACNVGGTAADVAKMLFGSYKIPGVGRIITNQENFERSDIKKGIFISLPSLNGKYPETRNDKPVEICGYQFIPNHTYIINNYDEKNDTVSVSNPYWEDRKDKEDDMIIPFNELQNNHFRLDYILSKYP